MLNLSTSLCLEAGNHLLSEEFRLPEMEIYLNPLAIASDKYFFFTCICQWSHRFNLFPQWKLMKVIFLFIFNMNFGISVPYIKFTLWIVAKLSFCNCIVTRKGSVMSFSFTFSSLYEEIQSFLIKTSVLFGCVFRVKSVLTLFV